MDLLSWATLVLLLAVGFLYLAVNKGLIVSDGPSVTTQIKRLLGIDVSPATSVSASADTAVRDVGFGGGGDRPSWLNEFLQWIYNHYKGQPRFVHAWLASLNDAAKKANIGPNCDILFEEVTTQNCPLAPQLSNVRAELGPRDHLTVKCSVTVAEVGIRLVSSQRYEDRLIVSNFDAKILDLKGEVHLRVACIANELFLMGCFNKRPDMHIDLINTDLNTEERVDSCVVDEAIRRCLVSAVTNVTLSNVRTAAGGISSDGRSMSTAAAEDSAAVQDLFDRISPLVLQPSPLAAWSPAKVEQKPPQTAGPVQEMFKRLSSTTTNAANAAATSKGMKPNKLKVTLHRAQKLNAGEGLSAVVVQQPYVVIEMDDPAQKFQSAKGLNAHPFFEEEFSFELNENSEEVLFEVYDANENGAKTQAQFLGLAIVSFDEIRRSTTPVHTLTLQGRPYHNDVVSGALIVEFEFFFDPASPEIGKKVEVYREEGGAAAVNGGLITHTVTTTRRPFGGDVVPVKTSTVVVKSVSQHPPPPKIEVELETGGAADTQQLSLTSSGSARHNLLVDTMSDESSSQRQQQTPSPEIGDGENERGRSKKRRSSSFFGDLRDRLSFGRRRRRRPKSADAVGADAVLMDAASSSNAARIGGHSASVPPSRDTSETRQSSSMRSRSPYTDGDSSFVVGSTSNLYQRSTLVVELTRNNVSKYYLIPPNQMSDSVCQKLMKKGRKLHIFNEHTFVAARIRGGTLCGVCNRRIGSSFSKQAYQCRDCRLLSHKFCHFKTDTFCPCSNVSNLEM